MKDSIIRKLAILMILVMTGSSAVFAAATTVSIPPDVTGAAYEEAVKALFEKEIITGDTDGKFHPDANLTRAQACIIVVKSMNPPAAEVVGTATQPAAKSGFSDMSGYGWAEGYINYAVKHGVTKGYPDGTFKPGKNVTMNELLTMVLRAADFSDENLGGAWPSNYIAKATELNLLNNIPSPLPTLATKWMAAQMDYNTLDRIEVANPPAETPGQGEVDAVPDTSRMIYANASFNSTITTYNGMQISDAVIVYTYGESKNFNSTMIFSKKISDYRIDTVYKYKNVKTPAFYLVESGKITKMVIPMDTGFSGKAYSVINKTMTTINAKDETVTGIATLTATREITWIGKRGLVGIPLKEDYLQGEIYELNLSGGEIQSIYKADDAGKKGVVFEEISGTATLLDEVESFNDGIVKISGAGGAMFEVKSNASVYVLDQGDSTEYTAGKLSSIKEGVQIRAYDISDDEMTSADIVVVLK